MTSGEQRKLWSENWTACSDDLQAFDPIDIISTIMIFHELNMGCDNNIIHMKTQPWDFTVLHVEASHSAKVQRYELFVSAYGLKKAWYEDKGVLTINYKAEYGLQ